MGETNQLYGCGHRTGFDCGTKSCPKVPGSPIGINFLCSRSTSAVRSSAYVATARCPPSQANAGNRGSCSLSVITEGIVKSQKLVTGPALPSGLSGKNAKEKNFARAPINISPPANLPSGETFSK